MGLYMGDTNITFGLQGKDGENGVSPTISVSEITGGHQFTINDVNGSKSVDIMDGKKGDKGDDGRSIWYTNSSPKMNPETEEYEYEIGSIKLTGNKTVMDGDYIFSTTTYCLYYISGYAGDNMIPVKLMCNLKGDKGDKGEKGDNGLTYQPVMYEDGDNVMLRWTTGMAFNDPVNIKGDKGDTGKTAYAYAKDGGYTGTESEFAHKLAVPFITPEMYGAKGDGLTDDSAAIQAAIDNAGEHPVYLSKKNYAISSGLVIRRNYTVFRCDGTITYDGTGAAMTLTNTLRSVVDVNSIYAESGTAIKLDNAEGSVTFNRININNIRTSKTGVHLVTSNITNMKPIYYNEIHFMDIRSSEIGIHVEAIGYYINENRYYGGTIGNGCACGFKIESTGVDGNVSEGKYSTGRNLFLAGGLEGMATDGCALYLKDTDKNVFKDIRCLEYYGKNSVVMEGVCRSNDIGLAAIKLHEVDISELNGVGNEYNILRALSMSCDGSTLIAKEVRVSDLYGFSYDTKTSDSAHVAVTAETFADNIIQQMDGVRIPTSLRFADAVLNGQTFTLGAVYTELTSLTRGLPVTLNFPNSNGKIKLIDKKGNTVIDNTEGRYARKTVSVCWTGYAANGDDNVWSVTILDETAEESAERITSEHDADKKSHEDIRESIANVNASLNVYTNLMEGFLPKVPAEYQQLVSIQTDGNKYFDTGILASGHPEGIKYVFKGKVIRCDTENPDYLFGALDSGKRSGNLVINEERMQMELALGGKSGTVLYSPFVIGERFELVVTATSLDAGGAVMYKDGVECSYDDQTPVDSEMPDVNIFLLKVNGSSKTNCAIVEIEEFSMYKPDGTPLRNYTPCYRKADNVIGLYDCVSGVFNTGLGSGTLAAGQEFGMPYYEREETYTKTEVDNLISGAAGSDMLLGRFNSQIQWNSDETVYTETWSYDGSSYSETITIISDTQYTKKLTIDGVEIGLWTITENESNNTIDTIFTAL